jgi:hypothetical protein
MNPPAIPSVNSDCGRAANQTPTIKQPTPMKPSHEPTVNTVRTGGVGAVGVCMYTGDAGAFGLCIYTDKATYIRLESSAVYFKSTL